jgi:opacity protein-like surface antigen
LTLPLVSPCMRLLIFSALILVLLSVPAMAADVTGTWTFSVDLENGQHGDPVFVLTQAGAKLTGSYNGPFGEQKVTGVVEGDTARFEVAASNEGGKVTLSYAAKIQGPDKMSGTMTRNLAGDSTPGKWTAVRKK